MRARGVRPWSARACSLTTNRAAEASLIWLDTAAVSRPSSTSGGRERILSQLGSRGPSSWSNPASGAISTSNRPSSRARSARVWDSAARASISSRLVAHFSAIISAPRNWLTSPSP